MEQKQAQPIFAVEDIRHLTETTYVVQITRNGLQFRAGQHLSVGKMNDPLAREYSIYSSETDPFLEILVKEVEQGTVSKQLKWLKKGDLLRVQGPMGFFVLNNETLAAPHLLIATGTGVSPFHSYILSNPKLNYRVLHGVRYGNEAYECFHFKKEQYTLCTSRDKTGNFYGRVTNYLQNQTIPANTQVYLCGNCDMIFEAYDILAHKGISTEQIHTEVYF